MNEVIDIEVTEEVLAKIVKSGMVRVKTGENEFKYLYTGEFVESNGEM